MLKAQILQQRKKSKSLYKGCGFLGLLRGGINQLKINVIVCITIRDFCANKLCFRAVCTLLLYFTSACLKEMQVIGDGLACTPYAEIWWSKSQRALFKHVVPFFFHYKQLIICRICLNSTV